ncbi:biotin synthase-like enzyme [Bradyrhizobium sp. USDA 4463]
MTDELQALCFLAGANSIFIGDVLLTTNNPKVDRDADLLGRLGITSGLARRTQCAQSVAPISSLGEKCR